jgi:hypothetical protein
MSDKSPLKGSEIEDIIPVRRFISIKYFNSPENFWTIITSISNLLMALATIGLLLIGFVGILPELKNLSKDITEIKDKISFGNELIVLKINDSCRIIPLFSPSENKGRSIMSFSRSISNEFMSPEDFDKYWTEKCSGGLNNNEAYRIPKESGFVNYVYANDTPLKLVLVS